MTTQDARERAWEAEDSHFADQQIPKHSSRAIVKAWWKAGWDAAKRQDEQRIAALVAAAEASRREMLNAGWGAADHVRALGDALRALAGGEEGASA